VCRLRIKSFSILIFFAIAVGVVGAFVSRGVQDGFATSQPNEIGRPAVKEVTLGERRMGEVVIAHVPVVNSSEISRRMSIVSRSCHCINAVFVQKPSPEVAEALGASVVVGPGESVVVRLQLRVVSAKTDAEVRLQAGSDGETVVIKCLALGYEAFEAVNRARIVARDPSSQTTVNLRIRVRDSRNPVQVLSVRADPSSTLQDLTVIAHPNVVNVCDRDNVATIPVCIRTPAWGRQRYWNLSAGAAGRRPNP
jgi:hypothetical protein